MSVLGYLQRGGTPSPYDRVLANQFGVAAADFLAREDFGKLVAMQNNKIVGVPLSECAGKVKNIPLDYSERPFSRNLFWRLVRLLPENQLFPAISNAAFARCAQGTAAQVSFREWEALTAAALLF